MSGPRNHRAVRATLLVAAAAMACAGAAVIVAAGADRGPDASPTVPAQAGPEATPSPVAAPVAAAEPPPEKEWVTDLLADPSFLDFESPESGRIVSFMDASGLWAVADMDPVSWPEGTWAPGQGMRLAPGGVRLRLHEDMVASACVHAEIASAEGFGLVVYAGGRKIARDVAAGASVVELACAGSSVSAEAMVLRLEASGLAEGAQSPMLLGLIVAPNGAEPAPGAVGKGRACGEGGVGIAQGETLRARALAGVGDAIDFRASGDGAADLGIGVRADPGGKIAIADPAAGLAPLGLDREAFLEIAIELPGSAGGPACVERLAVLHRKPAPPAIAGPLTAVDGVVLVVVDALRADALGSLEPGSPVKTPVLADLAARSVVFEAATAHADYTKASVGTILTGLYPHAHGGLAPSSPLSPDAVLITESLQGAGVDTLGILANMYLLRDYGLRKGWGKEVAVDPFKASVDGGIVADAAVKAIAEWRPEGRFFLYVHMMDPHAPYTPPRALEIEYVGHRVSDGRFTPASTDTFVQAMAAGKVAPPDEGELEDLVGLYRAEVAASDANLGRIVEALSAAGLLDRSLLIVTSDHGEEFMEHDDLGHGLSLHPETTHVPLMARFPGGETHGRWGGTVGLVDLAPTILEALGVGPRAGMQGESLLRRIVEAGDPGSPPAYLMEHGYGTTGMRLGSWMIVAHRRYTSMARLDGCRSWYQDPERHPIMWMYLRERLAILAIASRVAPPTPPPA